MKLPRALDVLRRSADAYLADHLDLASVASAVDAHYPTSDADADVAANLRAHRRMFERLVFFAHDREDAFWAFHRDHLSDDDAPVVRLDDEGRYDWLAAGVAEALFRFANESSWMRVWLEKSGLALPDVGDIGASTQFLPSLQALHERWYWEERGEPRTARPGATAPAIAGDPETWLLRPASEVEPILIGILRVPRWSFVACDADGRVETVWLHRAPATESMVVRGIGFGAREPEIVERLGTPTRRGAIFLRYDEEGRALHFEFADEVVDKITLMVL